MDANQINADNYPIGHDKVIRLLLVEKVKKLPKGTKLFSVGGKEVTVGFDELDLDTNVFQRSKYGELIQATGVEATKKEKSHGKSEKIETKHRKKS